MSNDAETMRLLTELHARYDAHGCHLVDHLAREYGASLGIKPSSVWTRLDAYLTQIERPWSLVEHAPDRTLLNALAGAADGGEAYSIADRAGIAPPTFRKFLSLFLYAGAFPELEQLKHREDTTMDLMVMGLGRRACVECAATHQARRRR